MPTNSSVFSVYRSGLREIARLPDPYLQQFFRLKVNRDIRAVLQSKPDNGLQRRKFKRVAKEVQKLEMANMGNANKRARRAFEHVLDLAYGRKGPLRWDIMKPLLTAPGAALPPRIISGVEKSRPPVYSSELAELLTSQPSRRTKPLKRPELASPPTLPPRADPNSTAAKFFGLLSKRREVNIRWRYFTEEWKKIFPPLQVNVIEETVTSDGRLSQSDSSQEALTRAGIRGVGLQGKGVHEELVMLAGSLSTPPPTPRRQRNASVREDCSPLSPASPKIQPRSRFPTRWLRRRYQELLGRLPTLNYIPETPEKGSLPSGSYEVKLEHNALAFSERYGLKRLADPDEIDKKWLQLAAEADAAAAEEEKRLRKLRTAIPNVNTRWPVR